VIREIERNPRKNRDLVYEIEGRQARNVVTYALWTTFIAEAAFIIGIAMIVVSLLVSFPIFPGDKIITLHLRVAGVVLTAASLVSAWGAYVKARKMLLLGLVLALAASLSASNMGASSAMLRNWLSEVQRFCKNDQLDGVTPKACTKQNNLALAATSINYVCWCVSVLLAWSW
jgi:hypothetical protein